MVLWSNLTRRIWFRGQLIMHLQQSSTSIWNAQSTQFIALSQNWKPTQIDPQNASTAHTPQNKTHIKWRCLLKSMHLQQSSPTFRHEYLECTLNTVHSTVTEPENHWGVA